MAVERMWGEHAQETDIGVLKFKIVSHAWGNRLGGGSYSRCTGATRAGGGHVACCHLRTGLREFEHPARHQRWSLTSAPQAGFASCILAYLNVPICGQCVQHQLGVCPPAKVGSCTCLSSSRHDRLTVRAAG